MRFGSSFKKPPKKAMRLNRAKKNKLYTPEQVRDLIDIAPSDQLKAMILLAINCGFGNTDCSELTVDAVDLDGAWIDYPRPPRPKTGVRRRCKIWPETRDALTVVINVRRTPKDRKHRNLVFLTLFRLPWVEEKNDAITYEFRKHIKARGYHRPGLSFYALRSTFATIGRQTGDVAAVKAVMGHVDDSVLNEHYSQSFPDERLEAVANHAHGWLFGTEVSR